MDCSSLVLVSTVVSLLGGWLVSFTWYLQSRNYEFWWYPEFRFLSVTGFTAIGILAVLCEQGLL